MMKNILLLVLSFVPVFLTGCGGGNGAPTPLPLTPGAPLAGAPATTPTSAPAAPTPLTSSVASALPASPAPAPDTGATAGLKVKVLDVNQAPVAGATVTLSIAGQTTTLTTNASGVADAGQVATGTRILGDITATGFGESKFDRQITAPNTWGVVTVELGAADSGRTGISELRQGQQNTAPATGGTVAFVFHVRDFNSHTPLAGAAVAFTSTADGSSYNGGALDTTTDAKGLAQVAAPEGTPLTVTVTAQGFATYTTKIDPGPRAASRDVIVALR